MARCPKCGGTNTLEIVLMAHGYLTIAAPEIQRKKLFPKYSRVKAQACASCGHIFDFMLENPEMFAPFAGYNSGKS